MRDYVDKRIHECPANVDAYTVLSYAKKRYGESLDVANTETPEHGPLVVGWTFPAPEWARDRDVELAAIPSYVGPRGATWSRSSSNNDAAEQSSIR